jgi:PST family polysaccharide transporter
MNTIDKTRAPSGSSGSSSNLGELGPDLLDHKGLSALPWIGASFRVAKSGIAARFHGVLSAGFRKIIENFSWLMFDRVVRMGMGLLVGVWVARYLGPAQFGSLNFAISFVALFGSIATLGMDTIVVREIVCNSEATPEILGTTIALRGCAAILATIVTIAAIRLIQPHDREALLLVAILSVGSIFQTVDTIDLFFQSQVRSKISVWSKNSAFLVFAAVRIALIHFRATLWPFALAGAGEVALGACGLIVGYHFSGGRFRSWRSGSHRAVELLKQSWPAIFSGLAIMIYMRIDMVMLKMMRGDVAAGLYAAVTRVSEVWYFIPVAIVSSVSPAIMRAKNNPELFYSRLRKLFFLMTWIALGIGSIVALFSSFIVRHLYSVAYSAAAPVLAVHIWASVFVFLGVAQSPWDTSQNLLKLSLYRTVAGAVINVAMNIFLIPRYSAMGAAIATVVAYAISAVIANAFSARTRVIFLMQIKSFLP